MADILSSLLSTLDQAGHGGGDVARLSGMGLDAAAAGVAQNPLALLQLTLQRRSQQLGQNGILAGGQPNVMTSSLLGSDAGPGLEALLAAAQQQANEG
jgi:hypothetical protein